jgi:hypothetical protein
MLRPPAMSGLVSRVRATPRVVLVPTVSGLAVYLAVAASTFGVRIEHLLVTALAVFLSMWSDGSRRVLVGLVPFLVFGVAYDLSRLATPYVRYLHVHIAEPFRFDQSVFGIPTAAGRLTPTEFFARHHSSLVDFFTGLAYILYLYWPIGFALYLLIRRRDAAGHRLLQRFGWTFCAVNIVGFVTYYLYPAAPPWYATAHGFGPPDFTVSANPAAAARWDALTGLSYFSAFYGRSAEVFGAIPSLHVCYPLLVFLFARELGRWRLDVANFSFYLLLCFSAVYLQHHYVLDILVGSGFALAGYGMEHFVSGRLERTPAAVVAGTTRA